jgi:hypothetical protein
MKKLQATLISLAVGIVFSIGVMAQGPPNPPSDLNAGGNQPPSGTTGAPIDPGTGLFLILAACYGVKKAYDTRKKTAERV